MSQTDSNWREAITLHIGREPIHLDWVASSGIDFGELGAGWVPTAMIGTPLRPSRSTGWLGMSGGQAVGPSYDWDGDSAVQRLDFEVVLPPVRGDGPRPANPVPEPTAALLFSVGMTILATVRQRRK
jgi:hypothetical protein